MEFTESRLIAISMNCKYMIIDVLTGSKIAINVHNLFIYI